MACCVHKDPHWHKLFLAYLEAIPNLISNTHHLFSCFGSYSVVVITFGFDPNNPGSNPGRTFFAFRCSLARLPSELLRCFINRHTLENRKVSSE